MPKTQPELLVPRVACTCSLTVCPFVCPLRVPLRVPLRLFTCPFTKLYESHTSPTPYVPYVSRTCPVRVPYVSRTCPVRVLYVSRAASYTCTGAIYTPRIQHGHDRQGFF